MLVKWSKLQEDFKEKETKLRTKIKVERRYGTGLGENKVNELEEIGRKKNLM